MLCDLRALLFKNSWYRYVILQRWGGRNAFDRLYTRERLLEKHLSFDIHHSLFIIRYSLRPSSRARFP